MFGNIKILGKKKTPEQKAAAKAQQTAQERLLLEDKRPEQGKASSEASESFSSSRTEKESQQQTAQNDEPDHFDDLIIGAARQEEQQQQEQFSGDICSKDEFARVFVGCFQVGSHVSGLQSLNVPDGDGRARAASDALYDTCLDVPYLRSLLMPQNKWIERGFALACFTVPMAINVKAEIAARRPAQQKPDAQPKAKPEPQKGQEPSDIPDQAQAAALGAV